jgi:DNA-binding CsgD family transcriptional regulator
MYCTAERYEESINAHQSALEIRKRLAESNRDAFIEYLAYTYVNLGDAYNEAKRYDESVGLMVLAKDIFKELAVIKPVPHLEYLADCYCNLGISYTRSGCFAEAENQLGLALEIQKKQAENDPGVYEPRVAKTYSDFGRLYISAKRYADAEVSYNIAIKMLKRLSEHTPEAFGAELAKCYVSMSELHAETERYSEAEEVLISAIDLYEKYAETDPACAEKAADARNLLESLTDAKHRSEAAHSGLTEKEKSIAGLLADGLTKREIIRKLNIDAKEYERNEIAIREKLGIVKDTDPVIESAVAEYKLTKRETEILRCLRNSKTSREIAAELFLSEETVKKHIRNLMKKMPSGKRSSISEF